MYSVVGNRKLNLHVWIHVAIKFASFPNSRLCDNDSLSNFSCILYRSKPESFHSAHPIFQISATSIAWRFPLFKIQDKPLRDKSHLSSFTMKKALDTVKALHDKCMTSSGAFGNSTFLCSRIYDFRIWNTKKSGKKWAVSDSSLR